MRIAVPLWTAVGRFEERSPVTVPRAAVLPSRRACSASLRGHVWRCTRRKEHGGRHLAALGTGEVLAVWP